MNKTLLLTTISAVALAAVSPASAANYFVLTQVGSGNIAPQGPQVGDPNGAIVNQNGTTNSAMFNQNGTQNTLLISQQNSISSTASITQNGTNDAVVTQGDPGVGGSFSNINESVISQNGNRQFTHHYQIGNDNDARSDQTGARNIVRSGQYQTVFTTGNSNYAKVNGNDNEQHFTQRGSNVGVSTVNGGRNYTNISQDNTGTGFSNPSFRNVAANDVNGTANYFNITQLGNNNTIGGPGSAAGVSLVATGAWKQNGDFNYANVFQRGSFQGVSGEQNGNGLVMDVSQRGDNNYGYLKQVGLRNTLYLSQGLRNLSQPAGSFNIATVNQTGTSGYGEIVQIGSGNSATLNDGGDTNNAVIIQEHALGGGFGSGNTAVANFDAGSASNSLYINQKGANFAQYNALAGARNNRAEIWQNNSGSFANANDTRISQAGDSNILVASATGDRNVTVGMQNGNSNRGLIQVSGNDNRATLTQNGVGKVGQIVMSGNGQTMTVTQ